MTELPPDPPRLRAILAYLDQRIAETETVATYLRLQTTAVRQALAAAERPAPAAPPQRRALEVPAQQASGYVVEKQLHAGHPLSAAVHRADCTVIQRDANPIGAEDARRALTADRKFFRACEFCQPGAALRTAASDGLLRR